MTSGLRSIRDKSLIYFEEDLKKSVQKYDKLYKIANAIASQIRVVYTEDAASLKNAGFDFNIHMILAGQMSGDTEHQQIFIYPQGNWVVVTKATPYQIIGATPYGKPVLDRTLQFTDSLPFALKVGCLAFDSTRISAADVDFPLDVILYAKDSYRCIEHRYQKDDLREVFTWWQNKLRESVDSFPSSWFNNIYNHIPRNPKDVSPVKAVKVSTKKKSKK